MFGCTLDRVRVIPLSGQHVRPQAIDNGVSWPFSGSPYLICPANTTLHKNHEVLFSGVARSNVTYPLVLTGSGTDFWLSSYPRAVELRKRAEEAGLEWNRSLFGLGYLADPVYYSLLESAWALVMPTLAEGGGSFPVAEAMQTGIPVIASDIPVMREWVDRMAGRILWFDPSSPDALAATLAELDRSYPTYKTDRRGTDRNDDIAQLGRCRRRLRGPYGNLSPNRHISTCGVSERSQLERLFSAETALDARDTEPRPSLWSPQPSTLLGPNRS